MGRIDVDGIVPKSTGTPGDLDQGSSELAISPASRLSTRASPYDRAYGSKRWAAAVSVPGTIVDRLAAVQLIAAPEPDAPGVFALQPVRQPAVDQPQHHTRPEDVQRVLSGHTPSIRLQATISPRQARQAPDKPDNQPPTSMGTRQGAWRVREAAWN